jgi:hypothetical protein
MKRNPDSFPFVLVGSGCMGYNRRIIKIGESRPTENTKQDEQGIRARG